MWSEKNQQITNATKTKTIERIMRLLSSSRCSRKDIWPPISSSGDFSRVLKEVRKLDMNSVRDVRVTASRVYGSVQWEAGAARSPAQTRKTPGTRGQSTAF